MKFHQWYTQALGALIGMLTCIHCYIHGDLLLYSNLSINIHLLNPYQIIASYILYPLCILTFLMALLIPLIKNFEEKKILGIRIKKLNIFIKYLTIIVGISGCLIYFALAAFILVFSDIISFFSYLRSKFTKNTYQIELAQAAEEEEEEEEEDGEAQLNPILTNTFSPENTPTNQYLAIKTEMAINLLNQNASLDFINEITGLSMEYLTKLQEENLNILKEKDDSTI